MQIDRAKLLQAKEVIEEINRHKWLQSEMLGYDIGFDKAADDWFEKYASAWLAYNLPRSCKNGNGNGNGKFKK